MLEVLDGACSCWDITINGVKTIVGDHPEAANQTPITSRNAHWKMRQLSHNDIIEAHCYVVITSESILMRKYVAESINQTTDCRTFRPCRPSSTAYSLYAVDEGRKCIDHVAYTVDYVQISPKVHDVIYSKFCKSLLFIACTFSSIYIIYHCFHAQFIYSYCFAPAMDTLLIKYICSSDIYNFISLFRSVEKASSPIGS